MTEEEKRKKAQAIAKGGSLTKRKQLLELTLEKTKEKGGEVGVEPEYEYKAGPVKEVVEKEDLPSSWMKPVEKKETVAPESAERKKILKEVAEGKAKKAAKAALEKKPVVKKVEKEPEKKDIFEDVKNVIKGKIEGKIEVAKKAEAERKRIEAAEKLKRLRELMARKEKLKKEGAK